ncbi:Virginiamycin B lyase [Crateriforma conspicua]|uniref:Virginiamycin B lyase n=1 Tax=Crateriforma conspicua TaxID=2527996 RepID=A0A5C5Y0S7_9PLAN|nr:Virginiamycin B lyase [Crateriforma conspicua]
MRKVGLIVTLFHRCPSFAEVCERCEGPAFWWCRGVSLCQKAWAVREGWLVVGVCLLGLLWAEAATAQATGEKESGGQESGGQVAGTAAMKYPIAVAVESGDAATDDTLYIVDLELPGIWKSESGDRTLFAEGSPRFRQPLNRPRCIVLHPSGGILVGDSANREVYHIPAAGAEPKPLSGGKIGIPMSLAVDSGGQWLFVADAETQAIWRMPVDGGAPEWFARVNARGLAFRDESTLAAVCPAKRSVQLIDVSVPTVDRPDRIVENPAVTTVLDQRTFQFPAGLAVTDDRLLVTDVYAGGVFSVDGDGAVTAWAEGQDLAGPVGIAAGENAVWVADPQRGRLVAFSRDASSPKVVATRQ